MTRHAPSPDPIVPAHFIDHLDTPIGPLTLVVNGAGALCVAEFSDAHDRLARQLARFQEPGQAATTARDPHGMTTRFTAYFNGKAEALDTILVASQGTEFQRLVWAALRTIPYGQTWSYGQLANHIGRPKAVRAVGLANGANPIAIAVPCHRVIGANGKLTGYGGGIERKRWLLEHERTDLQMSLPY